VSRWHPCPIAPPLLERSRFYDPASPQGNLTDTALRGTTGKPMMIPRSARFLRQRPGREVLTASGLTARR